MVPDIGDWYSHSVDPINLYLVADWPRVRYSDLHDCTSILHGEGRRSDLHGRRRANHRVRRARRIPRSIWPVRAIVPRPMKPRAGFNQLMRARQTPSMVARPRSTGESAWPAGPTNTRQPALVPDDRFRWQSLGHPAGTTPPR